VAVFAPWPYRLGPLAIIAGLLLNVAGTGHRRAALVGVPMGNGTRSVPATLVTCGVILLIQAAFMAVYAAVTARDHDLPALADPLARLAGLLASTPRPTARTSSSIRCGCHSAWRSLGNWRSIR